ncbi:6-cysteine protein, putative [Plasmodium gallinaceum]|uniref:6-cysteine protein, putative n=1 Tax=Plasmodium gallinaceum TaxID=5849 RepID=A0A1J1H051_PLAGA|nr:6-cysteine protein, putative [Plasmodium gallinaceum]CRG98121.1 6-cysteine protein, putative [Plasmodium gallinaceum]
MKVYLLYVLLLCLQQLSVYSLDHVCDFTKESNMRGTSNKKICEINAKPFDLITFKCPKKFGPKCFSSVSLSDDINNPNKLEAPMNQVLYGSIVYGDSVLISPVVPRNTTFYCFCNIESKISKETKNVVPKSEKKQEKEEEEEEEEEEVIEEPEEINEDAQRALDRVKKGRSVKYSEKTKPKESVVQEELIEEEEAQEQTQGKSRISKIGIMKVVVSSSPNKIKGCDFGSTFSDYFTKPFPLEKHGGSRVCKIEANPGEFVGFKCIYDSEGSIEPKNCFEKVYHNNTEKNLKDIMPGYISYNNGQNAHYAFYIRLPHFIQSSYTIQCKCRSTQSEFDNYIFELDVTGGESDIIENSFKH